MDENQRPRMTMRVSRDGGRSYGAPVEVTNAAKTPLFSSVWPPCQCPLHKKKEKPS
jgi:hypothetical protein